MKPLFYILSVLTVIALAVWAYRENYATRAALRELDSLRAEIGTLRETRSVLAAEWAWLNRPERLRDLADMNFDTLGLLPLRPDQFGRVGDVPYPPDPPAAPSDASPDLLTLLGNQP